MSKQTDLVAAFMKANLGKTFSFPGGFEATVGEKRVESQSGSWARGFKFTTTTYGRLERKIPSKFVKDYATTEYSYDAGVTWQTESKPKRTPSMVVLQKDTQGEFAFDAIQKINRSYDPTYRW